MRRSASLPVLGILLAVGLAGCTSDPTDKVNPPITVFLTDDVTEQQKQAIESKLRAVPDAAEVTFVSREQSAEEMKNDLKDEPDLLEKVKAEYLPDTFKLTLRDRDAFDRAVAGSLITELRELPGVADVVYPTSRPPEKPIGDCVSEDRSAMPNLTDWREISVFLTDRISASEKRAVEAKLRAVPGAGEVRLETREQAAERFREIYRDIPEVAASGRPELLPESYRVELVDQAALARAADSELDVELCRMPGVNSVVIPPPVRE